MTITTKRGEEVIYRQVNDDSKHLNATIAHLMQAPTGTELQTVVSNNGHDMAFNNGAFPIEGLIRKVNGIVSRTATKKEA